MRKARPNFNHAVRALIKDVARRLPEFGHVRAARVLVVAGEARRASRGTVKPLAFAGAKSVDAKGRRKPVVRLFGRRMLYCITLRPLFFRASTPAERIATVVHELFHVSIRFDGTLSPGRRHDRLGAAFGKKLRPLVRRYLEQCPPEVFAPFAHDGEVRVWQWLERPVASYVPGKDAPRAQFTEEQLFLGVARMVTRRTRPASASKRAPKMH